MITNRSHNTMSNELTQSLLYNIRYLDKLFKVLKLDKNEAKLLSDYSSLEKFYKQADNTVNDRRIYKVTGKLLNIHKRINYLLSNIEKPDYLHSARKKRSYITNAQQHIGQLQVLTLDIESYFPSIHRNSIFRLFRNTFKCSHVVSDFLAHICTYQGILVTGSPLSMNLAFFASKDMFDSMYAFAKSENITMTVYVDDITFSGSRINSSFKYHIKGMFHKNGFQLNKGKTRFYSKKHTAREITGVTIRGNHITASEKVFEKLHNKLTSWKSISPEQSYDYVTNLKDSLLGLLYHVARFEPKYRKIIAQVQHEYIRYIEESLLLSIKQYYSQWNKIINTDLSSNFDVDTTSQEVDELRFNLNQCIDVIVKLRKKRQFTHKAYRLRRSINYHTDRKIQSLKRHKIETFY